MTSIFVKAGVITGIIFAGFVMVLLGVSIIPNVLDQQSEYAIPRMSDEELNSIFLDSEEYMAFADRFPDHEIGLFRDQNNAIFQAGSFNSETGNALVLVMKMQGGNEITGKNIHCERNGLSENYNDTRESTTYADGILISRIESTACLD